MKKFNELTTDEKFEVAIECRDLCLEAIQKYRHEDESWKEEFQKLTSMLHTKFGYDKIPLTIEKLELYERILEQSIGISLIMKALEE